MTNYENISKDIGDKNWNDCITHDNGQFAQAGGGKSVLLLSQPGQGKSTLSCYMAQMSRCLHDSKLAFVHDLIAINRGRANADAMEKYTGKIFLETCAWRARDMDAFSNIIQQNWFDSFKGSMGTAKKLYLWVHEDDINDVIFYSYNHKRQEIPVKYLPPPILYKHADELVKRLRWGCINVILEPQSYKLSPTLIQRLREKKMDISEEEERGRELARVQRQRHVSHIRKGMRLVETSYEKREVSPSYFWFDFIHSARRGNKNRHLMIFIDEVDDVFEARSEGDIWKFIEILANDWKDLRKANISTVLTAHETDFIDWRIMKRIDYLIWMAGASIHPSYSMLKLQNLVSDLPIGTFLIEKRKMDFGINTFKKIPYAQPAVRIDGLKGEEFNLAPSVASKLMKFYEDSWSTVKEEEIINLDEYEETKKPEEVPA